MNLEVEVAGAAVPVGGEVRDAGKLDHGGRAAHEGDRVVGRLGELVLHHLRRDEALRTRGRERNVPKKGKGVC